MHPEASGEVFLRLVLKRNSNLFFVRDHHIDDNLTAVRAHPAQERFLYSGYAQLMESMKACATVTQVETKGEFAREMKLSPPTVVIAIDAGISEPENAVWRHPKRQGEDFLCHLGRSVGPRVVLPDDCSPESSRDWNGAGEFAGFVQSQVNDTAERRTESTRHHQLRASSPMYSDPTKSPSMLTNVPARTDLWEEVGSATLVTLTTTTEARESSWHDSLLAAKRSGARQKQQIVFYFYFKRAARQVSRNGTSKPTHDVHGYDKEGR
ncbi:hypothetical protein EDD85DRAFT_793477 [Armillaria nabsnona]|nr:hypothetical protein EDD85DRAFT_793477 [Armillaria nabsnona]